YSSVDHRCLPSFPTRRSSDLALVSPLRRWKDWKPGISLRLESRPFQMASKASSWPMAILKRFMAKNMEVLSCQSESRRRRRGCRSEEHTSELQSRENLVCRLL